jgi:hypothetical protein
VDPLAGLARPADPEHRDGQCPNGATLSQDQAIRRWLFLYGPGAISSAVGLAPIGFLSTLISLAVLGYYIYLLYSASQDPRRQGFHDKQVDTVVVKRSAV